MWASSTGRLMKQTIDASGYFLWPLELHKSSPDLSKKLKRYSYHSSLVMTELQATRRKLIAHQHLGCENSPGVNANRCSSVFPVKEDTEPALTSLELPDIAQGHKGSSAKIGAGGWGGEISALNVLIDDYGLCILRDYFLDWTK